MKHFVFFIFCSLAASILSAQDDCGCDKALIKDKLETYQDSFWYAKYYETFSQSDFDQEEKKWESGASVPIPQLGGIVSGHGNYDDFQKIVHDMVQKYGSTEVGSTTDWKKVENTSPIAYPFWSKCMEDCISNPGVRLINRFDGEQKGEFWIKYKSDPEGPEPIFCKIKIETEDTTMYQTIWLNKEGKATITYSRKYLKNKSTSFISVNASKTPTSASSYTDDFKSTFYKPSGITVVSCEYSYTVTTSKLEVGEVVQNCMNSPTREHGPGNSRNFAKAIKANNTFASVNKNLISNNSDCGSRPRGMSCDNKWPGYYNTVSVIPSPGYRFISDLTNSNYFPEHLKLTGTMATWNGQQRCTQNDVVLTNTPDMKQMRVWLHQDVAAHLEMTSVKDITMHETTFAGIDIDGKLKFKIPTNRLTNYNVTLRLSDNSIVNINSQNANTLVYFNIDGDNTIFTLKRTFL